LLKEITNASKKTNTIDCMVKYETNYNKISHMCFSTSIGSLTLSRILLYMCSDFSQSKT
jgi:hypothetical protein